MKDLSRSLKLIKIIFSSISIIIIIVGLIFSYLIANLEDAPGFVLIGTTITLTGASIVYGFGEIIIQLNQNNNLLKKLLDKK